MKNHLKKVTREPKVLKGIGLSRGHAPAKEVKLPKNGRKSEIKKPTT